MLQIILFLKLKIKNILQTKGILVQIHASQSLWLLSPKNYIVHIDTILDFFEEYSIVIMANTILFESKVYNLHNQYT